MRWISVNEELPDNGRRVLTVTDLGAYRILICIGGHWRGLRRDADGKVVGWIDFQKPTVDQITAMKGESDE